MYSPLPRHLVRVTFAWGTTSDLRDGKELPGFWSPVSYSDSVRLWVRCIDQKGWQKSQSVCPDCSQTLPQSSVKPTVRQA